MRKYTVIIIFILVLETEVLKINAHPCNILSCIHLFDDLFIHSGERYSCSKFRKFQNCVNGCSLLFSTNVDDFKNGLQRVTDKVCYDERKYKDGQFWYRKCVERKKFQILNCIYGSWTMEPDEPGLKNTNIFQCRKIMDIEKCPSDVLGCREDTVLYAEKLLSKFFEPVQEVVCYGYSINDIWSVNVREISDHRAFSRCIDTYFKEIVSCIPSKWISNYHVEKYQYAELCLAFDTFVECLNSTIFEACEKNNIENLRQSFIKKIQTVFDEQCSFLVRSTTENVSSNLVLTPYSEETNRFVNLNSDSQNAIWHYSFADSESNQIKSISVISYIFLCIVMFLI